VGDCTNAKYVVDLLCYQLNQLKEVKMSQKMIPNIVVGRLPLYLRTLQRMMQEGRQVTSSQELGERLGISAAQIRKDLSQFGEFGKQGTGYGIEYLTNQLQKILHVDKVWDVIVVGAGDVGHALARYQGFKNRGFRIAMVFDCDPSKIGKQIGEFTIQDINTLIATVKGSGIKLAMLAVPAAQAQEVTNKLVEAGITEILNYAPINLNVPSSVHVEYNDPVIQLQKMSYHLG
jgi:redox-sensing transcriptional repressor